VAAATVVTTLAVVDGLEAEKGFSNELTDGACTLVTAAATVVTAVVVAATVVVTTFFAGGGVRCIEPGRCVWAAAAAPVDPVGDGLLL